MKDLFFRIIQAFLDWAWGYFPIWFKDWLRYRLLMPQLLIGNIGIKPWNSGKWVRDTATVIVENKGNQKATNCIATLSILKKPNNAENLENKYQLHWARDGEYDPINVMEKPIDIPAFSFCRLDFLFTQKGFNHEGCWLGTSWALFQNPPEINQFYLPPGFYEIELEIGYENGIGNNKKYKIISPEIAGDKFSIEEF
jgi:hypothetical protein